MKFRELRGTTVLCEACFRTQEWISASGCRYSIPSVKKFHSFIIRLNNETLLLLVNHSDRNDFTDL